VDLRRYEVLQQQVRRRVVVRASRHVLRTKRERRDFMTRWRSLIATLLGIVLVLHGLGNAVLPLRGVDVAAPGSWIAAIALLYVLPHFIMQRRMLLGIKTLAEQTTT
jgi:hypothetical protein